MRFIGNYNFLEPHNFISDPHKCNEYCHNGRLNEDSSNSIDVKDEDGSKLGKLDGKEASASTPLGLKNIVKSILFPPRKSVGPLKTRDTTE